MQKNLYLLLRRHVTAKTVISLKIQQIIDLSQRVTLKSVDLRLKPLNLDTLICRIIPSNIMSVCGLSLHQGSTESRKTLEQKFIFQIGTLNPHGINERFSSN